MLTKLGKYEIRRELGRGAMGIVYEGFDPFIERTVAIKTIQKSLFDQSEAQEMLNRFRREAQAAGRLTHPNIVSVYEYGEEGDVAFIAMEFIVGRELKEYFDAMERFLVKDAAHIMLQLLDALEYSHEHGVVHRDIKPSNIIITKGNQVKVVDFGIARLESSNLTQVGTVLGTPAYMSPEQFRGVVADSRSDIYSAGVLLYQFLTGDRPFSGSPTTLMHKVLMQEPMAPSELNPDVSAALDAVVRKAMAKKADERFQTAKEFRLALARAAGFAADSSGLMVDTDATLVALKTGSKAAAATEEATRVVARMPQAPPADDAGAAINFDLSALSTNIERQLQEAKRSVGEEAVSADAHEATLVVRPFSPAADLPQQEANSALLAGLAREAQGRQAGREEDAPVDAAYARDRRLHETLGRISAFLDALAAQVKKAQPPLNRSYNFGRRAVYANLACRSAHSDSRRQSLADTALLDYVFLSIGLSAPAPVKISRPRDMLELLGQQLGKVKLRALDNLEQLKDGPQDEWVYVRLAADFPMQVQFRGNYAENRIDVAALNLEAFGIEHFRLELDDVTPELLDGIGLFLLARTDKLPEALKRVKPR